MGLIRTVVEPDEKMLSNQAPSGVWKGKGPSHLSGATYSSFSSSTALSGGFPYHLE